MISMIDSQVQNKLHALYADSKENDPKHREELNNFDFKGMSELERYSKLNKIYMPVNVEFGNLLYSLVRSSRPETIVEFGLSFGISTIFLAAAVKDNGKGKIITTEFDEGKAAKALLNLKEAGLDEFVEIRIGDALETLKNPMPKQIDMLFMDGAKGMYMPVLKLIEPSLRAGAIIASDNTDTESLAPYLEYLRSHANGYMSTPIMTKMGSKAQEISIKL
jgi:predicted O-methyltransferase YrrM